MTRYWNTWFALCASGIISCTANGATASEGSLRLRQPLDPRGEIHVPIGIANTVDTLKTFVEAEGNFSPGYTTYGIYFWLYETKGELASVEFSGPADPPGGFALCLPQNLQAEVTADGRPVARAGDGSYALGRGARTVVLRWGR